MHQLFRYQKSEGAKHTMCYSAPITLKWGPGLPKIRTPWLSICYLRLCDGRPLCGRKDYLQSDKIVQQQSLSISTTSGG